MVFRKGLNLRGRLGLYTRKDPKRVIASLELLATLVAVRLWADPGSGGKRGKCWIKAGTDNQSNTYSISKWMSTKFPLTILILELSETLRTRSCVLELDWIPREQNQLADDLTNQVFDHFPADKRIVWNGGEVKWLVLDKLLIRSEEFLLSVQTAKEATRQVSKDSNSSKKRKDVGSLVTLILLVFQWGELSYARSPPLVECMLTRKLHLKVWFPIQTQRIKCMGF